MNIQVKGSGTPAVVTVTRLATLAGPKQLLQGPSSNPRKFSSVVVASLDGPAVHNGVKMEPFTVHRSLEMTPVALCNPVRLNCVLLRSGTVSLVSRIVPVTCQKPVCVPLSLEMPGSRTKLESAAMVPIL